MASVKTPVFLLAFGFSIGIVVESCIKIPAVWVFVCFLLALPFIWSCRGKKFFPSLIFLSLILLGILCMKMDRKRHANAIENYIPAFSTDFDFNEGRKWIKYVNLEGIVKTQPEVKTQGKKQTVSFVLSSRNLMRRAGKERTERANRGEFFQTQGDVQVFLFQPSVIPEAGDRVRLWGSLERPRPALNPGQFDYGRYLARNDIYAIFNGFGSHSLRVLKKDQLPFILRILHRTRRLITERIDALFTGNAAILFKALILGNRKGLSSEIRDDFMKTGTSHLLAISGLNITLVAGSFYFLLIALKTPQKMAAGCALVASSLYVFIAGSGLPVERAGLMAGAAFLGLVFERQHHFLNSFFAAFLILLLIKPASLLDISFQLSFLSVFSLVYFIPGILARHQWRQCLGGSVAVMLGTFPLVIYYFNIFSCVSILANLLAISLFDLSLLLAMFSLLFGGCPWLGPFLVQSAEGILQLGLNWIHLLSTVPAGYFFLSPPALHHLILYYLFLCFLFLIRNIKINYINVLRLISQGCWLVLMALFFLPRPAPEFKLTLLAAGKNEISHFQWGRSHHWLVNTGRGLPSNQGQWIINPYLRHQGINHLTGIILTDSYKKHSGGLEHLLNNFSLEYLIYPNAIGQPKSLIRKGDLKKINLVPVSRPQRIRIQGAGEISILAIAQNQIIYSVTWRKWTFLFLPSFHPLILQELVKHESWLHQVNILILPSAGRELAKGDESKIFEALFDLMDPEYVVTPSRNWAVETFLKDRDIPALSLNEYGAVVFAAGGNKKNSWLPFRKALTSELLNLSSHLKGKIGSLEPRLI